MPLPKHDLAAEADPMPPLPPSDTTRWSPRRKAAVILAARRGIISREEACRRYRMSPEEFAAWEAALDRNGIPGLRSTRQQNYRRADLARGLAQPARGNGQAWFGDARSGELAGLR